MKHIIDQTAWQESCNGIRCSECSMSDGTGSCRIDEYIHRQPVYEERPHGEWKWKKDKDALRTYDLLCSECGYKTFTCENYDNVEQAKKVVDDRIREGKTLFSFCPNCGADMQKEGDKNG